VLGHRAGAGQIAEKMAPRGIVRTSLVEWLQAALVSLNLAWTTVCLGGYLAETMVVTSALAAATFAVHFAARAWQPKAGAPLHPAGWILVPFLVFAAVNVLWITPVRWLGWIDWGVWALAIGTFWVVVNGIRARGPRTLLWLTLVGLGIVAVAMAAYQRFVQPDWLMLGRVQAPQFVGRASGPFGIPNSLAGFLLLLLPPVAVLATRAAGGTMGRFFFGSVTLVLAFGLWLTISRGGWIAFVLAVAAWPLLASGRSWPRRLALASGVLAVLLAAGTVTFLGSPRVRDRFTSLARDAGERTRPIMWRAAWKIFREQPVLGSGAGSYNGLFEKHRPEREQTEPVWTHNDYLNTLSDYGLVGFALFFGAAVWIAQRSVAAARCRPRGTQRGDDWLADPVMQRGFAVGLLAFAFQLFVDFHFKIAALGMACATCAALVVGSAWRRGEMREDGMRPHQLVLRRIASAAAACAIAIATMVWIVPRYRAEATRYGSRRQLDALRAQSAGPQQRKVIAEIARDSLSAAVVLDPLNGQAWADRAYAAAVIAHDNPPQELALGREAEADARRALALSAAVPEFWVRLGVALDMQKRWNDAGPAFAEALRLAPTSARMWFHQAYHLALNPVTQPLARSAVATCLRLDPASTEADSLRRHLASAP
jgi:O-antigen ligase